MTWQVAPGYWTRIVRGMPEMCRIDSQRQGSISARLNLRFDPFWDEVELVPTVIAVQKLVGVVVSQGRGGTRPYRDR